jgi:O-methyltransferase
VEESVSVAHEVRSRGLTYLSPERLGRLETCAREAAALGGDFVEAGVALGGSAILLTSLLPAGASFHGYDVFAMIPQPGPQDDEVSHARYEVIASGHSEGIAGGTYYGYLPDLYERVQESFAAFGMPVDGERIHLHRGLFEETLRPDAAIALAHIDCDWYDPVKTCLERITPWLRPGGLVVLDDYADYGGCRTATDEFLETRDELALVDASDNVILRKR